ncbi:hypothetical protein FA95DRAFT_193514 [Auriscalpium vulgare]|uniref:Uncharacterized protein n=1 Tax=Auriscalpium vulgare TaxID=40419 RepID=A0ACB8S610_9AGAM|nr:hypothetical protein FA95DRAFT_193514 [Auriscalpium vulgare]
MPDLEVDLVDQFICPLCVAKEPHLRLRTTWKKRCLYGQKQRNPDSPDACHRPARGAFSKYCSDECGRKYMESRIKFWEGKGGDRERLWESVKNADRREGVVVSVEPVHDKSKVVKMDIDNENPPTAVVFEKPKKAQRDRELERLRAQLDEVVEKRERLKKEMEVIVWREKLTELAIERAESVDGCGWDQRFCFGDEEVAEFGAGVLESYEEAGQGATGDAMQVDGAAEEGECWCQGKKKCDRHVGWQKLRIAEVQFEKEMKDQALEKLTTREREIRKRVEDIVDPQARLAAANNTAVYAPSPKPLPMESKPTLNGHSKTRPNGEPVKKGKKKKSEVM